MSAPAPIAARKLGDALRRAGEERSRITFPSSLFRGRIVEFARDVLGIRSLASHQVEILDEYQRNENASILVCTGQKMGKTECMVIAGAYDFATERDVKVWLYAPKVDHTNAVHWPRFSKYVLDAYLPCKACRPAHEAWCALVEVDPLDETPRPERCPRCSPLIPSTPKDPKRPELGRVSEWLNPTDAEAGLRAPDGRSLRAYTGRKEGSKGGFSGKLRLQADECSDIPDADRETWAGNLVGGGKLMGFGNLLHVHGWFAQAFRANSKESTRWTKRVQKSSRLSPNCPGTIRWSDGKVTTNNTTDRPIRGMATPTKIEENLRAWKGTNYICARIDATPPEIVAGQLATMQRVSEAGQRWATTRAEGQLQIGVDVARSRDKLAMAARRGRKIIEIRAEALGQDDHAKGAALVADFAAEHRKPNEPRPLVVFDKSGREGQDFAREIERYSDRLELVGVIATHKPRDWKRFDRKRDEMAFNGAAWLLDGAIPPDPELEAEFDVTTSEEVEVSYGGSGLKWRVSRVIDNDEVRKILGRSPDKRNAFELSVWKVDASVAEEDPVAEASPPQRAEVVKTLDAVSASQPMPSSAPRRAPAKRRAEAHDDDVELDRWGAADAGMRALWGDA